MWQPQRPKARRTRSTSNPEQYPRKRTIPKTGDTNQSLQSEKDMHSKVGVKTVVTAIMETKTLAAMPTVIIAAKEDILHQSADLKKTKLFQT